MNYIIKVGQTTPAKTMHKARACAAVCMLLSGISFLGSSAYAGSYDALCGGSKCQVVITPDSIRSPYGEIPPSRVTYWGSSGESTTSVGTGVATTIIFGPLGLLGFMSKNHSYDFTITGYDAEGKRVSKLIQFKNDKPAKRLAQELHAVTGLGMNQTRTLEEIKAKESGMQSEDNSIGPMPSQRR